jgi:colanic acid/amylovoran biosynthesis protein
MSDTVIVNTVALNGGDAAILDAVIDSVGSAFPDERGSVLVLDRDAAAASKYYGGIAFSSPGFEISRSQHKGFVGRAITIASTVLLMFQAILYAKLGIRTFRARSDVGRYFEIMSNAKRVISTGGTMFVERYSIYPKFFELAVAHIFNVPFFMFTQSFEPFRKPYNRLMMRLMLKYAQAVMVRGEESKSAIVQLTDDPSKIVVLADSVFRFAEGAGVYANRGLVCISVRPWSHASVEQIAAYRREMAQLCTVIVRELNLSVMFVSTCQGIPEYNVHDDEEARLIWQILPDDVRAHVEVDGRFRRKDELMDLYSSADAVIATRLHACILALCAGAAVIPISYEHKTHEVFGRIYPEAKVFDYETLQSDAVFKVLRKVLSDREEYLTHLMAGVIEERKSSRLADDILAGS